jgi:hypothetical protein
MTMAKTGAVGEDQKKIAAIAAFVVVAAAIFYFEYFYTPTPATPAPVATVPVAPPVRNAENAPMASGGKSARSLGTTSAALDPTLHMDAMLVSESVQYAGSGRNIFSPNSAPPVVVIPKPIASGRQDAVTHPIPCPPNCPPPVVQPKPPIDLKFFGVETASDGARKALLLHGEDVFVASAGEIVMRRYRVITVDAKTIEVEDMQDNDKQTLPLLIN